MHESLLVGELPERLRCIFRIVIGHNALRYAMACEERLQLFDYRFRVGSLEFGNFQESRVIVDRNKVLRVMSVKQVCSNAFPWPLWKLEWHMWNTLFWTIPLTLFDRSDHACNLAGNARPPDVPSGGLSAFMYTQMPHAYPLEDLCTQWAWYHNSRS